MSMLTTHHSQMTDFRICVLALWDVRNVKKGLMLPKMIAYSDALLISVSRYSTESIGCTMQHTNACAFNSSSTLRGRGWRGGGGG